VTDLPALRAELATVVAERRRNYRTHARKLTAAILAGEQRQRLNAQVLRTVERHDRAAEEILSAGRPTSIGPRLDEDDADRFRALIARAEAAHDWWFTHR
jgi:hypothetical protein